ncbi:MAG: hypothetical protein DCC58_04825 [Chloroflexi bacterium]|nr:MAG: hypothetical protein DCC58_04825 [Chloroflexota bacterium]
MARIALDRRSVRPIASVAAIVAQLRRLREDRALVGIVFAVVLVSSFIFASIPRLFNTMSDDGLRHAVDGSRSFLRNIEMARALRIQPAEGDDLYANIDAEGARFQESLAESIQKIIGSRSFLFDSPRYRFLDLPGTDRYPSPRYFTLRQGDAIESRLTLVSGRMPQATTERVPVPFDIAQEEAQVFEVAASAETLRQIGATVGDRFWTMPDPEDAIVRRTPSRNLQYVVYEVVGVIAVNDVQDPWWFADVRLDRAIEYDDGQVTHFYATALMAKDAYPQLLEAISPMGVAYKWRYFTDTKLFDAGDLAILAADVRRLDAEYPATGLAPPTDTTVRTGLSAIFRRYIAQRGLTEAMLSLASIGLLAVSLAVLGLVAALIAERRRDQTALLRGRGGSAGQLLAAQLTEGLLLAIPAAALGFVAASVFVGERASFLSPLVAFGLAGATALLLVVFLIPFVNRPLRAIERSDIVLTKVSPRRWAVEAGIVAVALAGVYLLRRRGLSAGSSQGSTEGFDIYLRDLVPSLGFRRVARQPSINSAPLLVLLLAVAVGVFSSVLLHSIDDGQIRTSWQTVGAPYRVDAFPDAPLYHGVDLTVVDSVTGVAPAFAKGGFSIVSRTPVFGMVNVLAVDTRTYAEINAGTPADPQFPRQMLDAEFASSIGTPANPIPAIVSSRWVLSQGPQRGETFALNMNGKEISFIVADVRNGFPTLPEGQSFVVTSLDALLATGNPRSFPVNRQYIGAPDAAYQELAATLASQSVSASLTARYQEYAKVHDAPLIRGTTTGFRIGIAIAAAYSALAVAVALALTARARARDIAFLRTLGMSDKQVLGLIVVEQAPPLVLSLIVGIALGIGTVLLIEPGIDMTAFTGPGVAVPVVVDYVTIGVLALGLVAVVAAAIALVTQAARRANLGSALRLGDE